MISHTHPIDDANKKPLQPSTPQQQQQKKHQEEAPSNAQPTLSRPVSSSSSVGFPSSHFRAPPRTLLSPSLFTPMPSSSSSSSSSYLQSSSSSRSGGSTVASTFAIIATARVGVATPRRYNNNVNNNNDGSCNSRMVGSLAGEQHWSNDVDNDDDDDDDDDNGPAVVESLDGRRAEEGRHHHHHHHQHNSSKSQTKAKRTTAMMNDLDDEDIEYYLSWYDREQEEAMMMTTTKKTTTTKKKSKPTPSTSSFSSTMQQQRRRGQQHQQRRRHSRRRQCQGMTLQGTQCTLSSLDPDDWKTNNNNNNNNNAEDDDDDDDNNNNKDSQSLLCDPNYCQHHQPSGSWVHQLRDPNRRNRGSSNGSSITSSSNRKSFGENDSHPRLSPDGRVVTTTTMVQQCHLVQMEECNDHNDHDQNDDDDGNKNSSHVHLQAGGAGLGSDGSADGFRIAPASVLPRLQQNEQPQPPQNYRETDVLAGRGMTINNHIGNRRLRLALHRIRNVFLTVETKSDKLQVVRQLVDTLRSKQVRFLRKSRAAGKGRRGAGGGQWEEMGGQVTVAWIMHRLQGRCAVCGAGYGEACWNAPTTGLGGGNETSLPPATMDTTRNNITTATDANTILPTTRKRVSFGKCPEHQPAPATKRTKGSLNDRMTATTSSEPQKHHRRSRKSSLSTVSTKKKVPTTTHSSSNSKTDLRCHQATHPNGETACEGETAVKFRTQHVARVAAPPRKLRSPPFQYSWLGTVEGNRDGTWMTYQEPLDCELATCPNGSISGGDVNNGTSQDLETWLATEILSHPVHCTAYHYAHFFTSLGFPSVESILTGLNADDLDAFQGFKVLSPYHRRRLRKVLHEYHGRQNQTHP